MYRRFRRSCRLGADGDNPITRSLGDKLGAIVQPYVLRNPRETKTSHIIELARQYGRYGYRRITASLRRAGWEGNKKGGSGDVRG
jgi:hypothetical protein